VFFIQALDRAYYEHFIRSCLYVFFISSNPKKPKKLLEQVRDLIRLKHYSYRTEKTYIYWIRRYILFHQKRHPKEMGPQEIETFLTHLAVKDRVSASTQNQAFNALLFLYREVLSISLKDANINALRARQQRNLPVVLSREETKQLLMTMTGMQQLMAKLTYGGGLRLNECLELRLKDLDFALSELHIWEGKGGKRGLGKFLKGAGIKSLI